MPSEATGISWFSVTAVPPSFNVPCCGSEVTITFCNELPSGSMYAAVKFAAAKVSVPSTPTLAAMSETLGEVSTASDSTWTFPTVNCAVLVTLEGM